MTHLRTLTAAVMAALLSLTVACARDATAPGAAPATSAATPNEASDASATSSDNNGSLAGAISGTVNEALADASKELAKESFTISKDGQPKAEITAAGDLMIDGKAVSVTAEQRAMLLDYRQHIVGVAQAGIEIGAQGAGLAGKAVTEALAGVFSGKGEEVEKKIEAEARKIELSAKKLCGRLPAMLASQDKLKAALPEFAPYARMTTADVEDCEKNGHFSN